MTCLNERSNHSSHLISSRTNYELLKEIFDYVNPVSVHSETETGFQELSKWATSILDRWRGGHGFSPNYALGQLYRDSKISGCQNSKTSEPIKEKFGAYVNNNFSHAKMHCVSKNCTPKAGRHKFCYFPNTKKSKIYVL